MAGNTIGKVFTVTTFGESHGVAIGAIVDGCPPGIPLSEKDLQVDLDRRRPGTSRYTTARREPDQVRILSGVFEGKTTGTPIGLLIENTDQRSKDYSDIAKLFRPGHADYCYHHKYGNRDYRGGGRSSARETAMRVAAGAIAKQCLAQQGITVRCCLSQLGPIRAEECQWQQVEQNPFFFPDPAKLEQLHTFMRDLIKSDDSIGARLEFEATGVPVGLGEPVFDRLDAELSYAFMGINAVKAVAIGDGFDVVEQRGSEHRDQMYPDGFASNHAGGVLGGISTGQPIRASVALKPTSSIKVPGKSIDEEGQTVEMITRGRHDPCVGIRAVPIVEAMGAIVLMDHWLRHIAQCGDVEVATPKLSMRQDQ